MAKQATIILKRSNLEGPANKSVVNWDDLQVRKGSTGENWGHRLRKGLISVALVVDGARWVSWSLREDFQRQNRVEVVILS